MKRIIARALAPLLLCGCVPDVGPPASLLVGPRVLAVRSEPAEVAPGEATRLTLYVAGPEPELAALVTDASWALCRSGTPPADNNFVTERCLQDESAVTAVAARGAQVEVQVPADACAVFGPQTPPVPPGQPPGRPRDPDATGGYYQPVRVLVPMLGLATVAGIRIVCGLPHATPESAAAYRMQYVRNRNPHVDGLALFGEGAEIFADAIPARATISLRLRSGADSAESFLLFDPILHALRTQTEVLRVSWFSSRGSFASATTTDGAQGEVGNTWVASDAPGPVLLWAVLRDTRGGVAVFSQRVLVR